jgi:hypothetical protein
MRAFLVVAPFAISIVTLGSSIASAQTTDPAAADALFQKGREAAEKGDWATACPKFAESQRLDPAPGTLLNLADCEEHLGQTAFAWEHFKTAMETLPSTDDRVPFAKQRMASLEKQVPHLTLSAAPDLPANAKVLRDDVQLSSASFGLALPVNPGQHSIVVSAPGHKDKTIAVTLKPGESQTVTLSLADADASGAAPAAPEAPAPATSATNLGASAGSGGSKKTLGYVVGGVGAAGIVVGAVTGLMVLGKKSTVNDPTHCDQTTFACDQAGVDAASSGKSLATISTAAFVGGAAALGAGVFLIVTSKDEPSSSATLVGPSSVAGGAGLTMLHTF